MYGYENGTELLAETCNRLYAIKWVCEGFFFLVYLQSTHTKLQSIK